MSIVSAYQGVCHLLPQKHRIPVGTPDCDWDTEMLISTFFDEPNVSRPRARSTFYRSSACSRLRQEYSFIQFVRILELLEFRGLQGQSKRSKRRENHSFSCPLKR